MILLHTIFFPLKRKLDVNLFRGSWMLAPRFFLPKTNMELENAPYTQTLNGAGVYTYMNTL